jgi:hypothetical protein
MCDKTSLRQYSRWTKCSWPEKTTKGSTLLIAVPHLSSKDTCIRYCSNKHTHLQILVRTKYKKDAAEKKLFDTAINALAVSKARQKFLSLVIPSVTNENNEKTKHYRFKKSGPRLGQGFGAASDEQNV